MKKFLALILALAMLLTLSACGSSDEPPRASKDLDSMTDEDWEDYLNDLDEAVEREEQEEREQQEAEEQEEAFDPYEVGAYWIGNDPYTLNLFEIFGLDNDFPMPKEDFVPEWHYYTTGYSMDQQTGETKEGVKRYELSLQHLSPAFYDDYRDEILEYVRARYSSLIPMSNSAATLNRNAGNNDYKYIADDGTVFVMTDSHSDGMIFTIEHYDLRTLEGTVTEIRQSIKYDFATDEELRDWPEYFYVATADGTTQTVQDMDWAAVDSTYLFGEFYHMERYPQEGDTVRIEYLCEADYSIESGGIGLAQPHTYVINIEYMN